MNNIKPRYVKVNEFGKKFITGYDRPDNNQLVVSLDNDKTITLKPTEGNYNKAENRMRTQSTYQVTEVLPALKTDRTIDITASIVCLAMSIITKVINLPISEQFQKVLHYVVGTLTAIGVTLSIDDLLKIKDVIKYQFFFDNKDFINSGVESSKNMLNGTNFITRRVVKNGNDKDAVSLTNIDKISLSDLETIKDNVETQADLQFELTDPIKRKLAKRK